MRPSASASTVPTATPTRAGAIPGRPRASRRPRRLAPSAIRTPISCVRWATDQATTPQMPSAARSEGQTGEGWRSARCGSAVRRARRPRSRPGYATPVTGRSLSSALTSRRMAAASGAGSASSGPRGTGRGTATARTDVEVEPHVGSGRGSGRRARAPPPSPIASGRPCSLRRAERGDPLAERRLSPGQSRRAGLSPTIVTLGAPVPVALVELPPGSQRDAHGAEVARGDDLVVHGGVRLALLRGLRLPGGPRR